MIIEEACMVNLHTKEKRDEQLEKRMLVILNDLLYLGEMMFDFSESIAEQIMIEDCTDIYFDENNLYKLARRHHYEVVFRYAIEQIAKFTEHPILDPNGDKDFKTAIKNCFQVDYDTFQGLLGYFMEKHHLKAGDCFSMDKDGFLKDLEATFGISIAQADSFLSGLILSRANKLPLDELLKRPHAVNRCLSRPLLLWTINGKEYCVFGLHSLYESENHLIFNSIPWGKIAAEWEVNKCFKEYMHRKKDQLENWLNDEVEKRIVNTGQHYDRHVTKLRIKKGYVPLEVAGLGEIDFIIISTVTRKILIADCKHLQGRYDLTNYKIDYGHFVKQHKDGYNIRMKGKVEWMQQQLSILEEHFQYKYPEASITLGGYKVEGIFFINTPTFYMYNADFRIYTFDFVETVINGEYKDPVMTYLVEEEDGTSEYIIKYPYFRKPVILEFPDDECEVDKYGDAI